MVLVELNRTINVHLMDIFCIPILLLNKEYVIIYTFKTTACMCHACGKLKFVSQVFWQNPKTKDQTALKQIIMSYFLLLLYNSFLNLLCCSMTGHILGSEVRLQVQQKNNLCILYIHSIVCVCGQLLVVSKLLKEHFFPSHFT